MVEKFLTNGHEAVGLTMLGKTAEMCIDKVQFVGSNGCYLMLTFPCSNAIAAASVSAMSCCSCCLQCQTVSMRSALCVSALIHMYLVHLYLMP